MANAHQRQKLDATVQGWTVGTPAPYTPPPDQARPTRGAKVPYRVCTDAGATAIRAKATRFK